jgi:calcineurin-like phosphoesterase family protein
MDETLILNHNSVVKHDDTVIHVGDFAFSNAQRIKSILSRLHGKYIFLPGNHDNQFWKDKTLLDRFENAAQLHEITKRIEGGKYNMSLEVKYGDRGLIVIQHYPLLTWNKSRYGAWMLHGHCHGSMRYPFEGKILDVGVDVHNYYPIALTEVEKIMNQKVFTSIDHHE